MAIRMMVGAERAGEPNVETVRNYPGHEEGLIQHGDKCPHAREHDVSGKFSPECVRPAEGQCYVSGQCTGPFGPLYMRTSHVGLVLELREYNGYDDSDFYAIVWDPEKGAPDRVDYASTRGWTYPNGAHVDATPEVLAAYAAWREVQRRAAEKRRAEQEERTIRRGKRVRVVKGRKVRVGTEGECFWQGHGFHGPRIGIRTADGQTIFLAESNCAVILTEEAAS